MLMYLLADMKLQLDIQSEVRQDPQRGVNCFWRVQKLYLHYALDRQTPGAS